MSGLQRHSKTSISAQELKFVVRFGTSLQPRDEPSFHSRSSEQTHSVSHMFASQLIFCPSPLLNGCWNSAGRFCEVFYWDGIKTTTKRHCIYDVCHNLNVGLLFRFQQRLGVLKTRMALKPKDVALVELIYILFVNTMMTLFSAVGFMAGL